MFAKCEGTDIVCRSAAFSPRAVEPLQGDVPLQISRRKHMQFVSLHCSCAVSLRQSNAKRQ